MSGAERLRAQAARATTRRTRPEGADEQAPMDTPEQAGAPRRRPAAAPRAKTVRITLDLAPLQYRGLNRWCDDAADELGVARVTAASVLRELLAQLDEDPELAQRIRQRLGAAE